MNYLQTLFKIREDIHDTQSKLSDILCHEDLFHVLTLPAGDHYVDSEDVQRVMSDITEAFNETGSNEMTLVVGKEAVPIRAFISNSQIRLQNAKSKMWSVDVFKTYQEFVNFVNSCCKVTEHNVEDFCTFFTYDHEIEGLTMQDCEDIFRYDQDWYAEACLDGTDNHIILTQLAAYYDETGTDSGLICLYNDGHIEVLSALKTLANHDLNYDDLMNGFNNALDVQSMLAIISDQIASGNVSKQDLVNKLIACRNSYGEKGAEILEEFLDGIQDESASSFAYSLFNVYTNMSKTTASNNELSFYEGNYVTEAAFSTIIKTAIPTIVQVLSTVLVFVNPIVGAIGLLVSTAYSVVSKFITEQESPAYNIKAINRCVGYPLFQKRYLDSQTDHPFVSYVNTQRLVTVETPIMLFSSWHENNTDYICSEAFPIVDFDPDALENFCYTHLGFESSMSGAGYTHSGLTASQISNAWKELASLRQDGIFLNLSVQDQLRVIKLVMVINVALGGGDYSVVHYHSEYNDYHGQEVTPGQEVPFGRDLNYIVNNLRITTWEQMYEWYSYFSAMASTTIGNDYPDVSKMWYEFLDVKTQTSDGYDIAVGCIMPKHFWDRDNLYVVPPRFEKGSIVSVLVTTAIVAAAVIVTALVIRRKFQAKMRTRYASIQAKEAYVQEGLKDGTLTEAQATAKLQEIRKDIKRYNILAKLTKSSTLSYFSGWENGDVTTTDVTRAANGLSDTLSSINNVGNKVQSINSDVRDITNFLKENMFY